MCVHTCVCKSGGMGGEPASALWGCRARPTLLPQRGRNSAPGSGGTQIPDSLAERKSPVSRRETPHLWGAKPVLSHFFSISSSENRSGEEWSRKGTDAGTRGGPGAKEAEKAEDRGAEDEATQRRSTRPVQGPP